MAIEKSVLRQITALTWLIETCVAREFIKVIVDRNNEVACNSRRTDSDNLRLVVWLVTQRSAQVGLMVEDENS